MCMCVYVCAVGVFPPSGPKRTLHRAKIPAFASHINVVFCAPYSAATACVYTVELTCVRERLANIMFAPYKADG
jgi:hypothetical protein